MPLVLSLGGGEGRGEDGEKEKRGKKLHSSGIDVSSLLPLVTSPFLPSLPPLADRLTPSLLCGVVRLSPLFYFIVVVFLFFFFFGPPFSLNQKNSSRPDPISTSARAHLAASTFFQVDLSSSYATLCEPPLNGR